MDLQTTVNFSIRSLGIQEIDAYDIEVEDNHNFFGNGILVHNSNYITLEEVIQKLGLQFETDDEFRLWSYDFIDNVLQPLIDRTLAEYAKDYGVKQKIKFKREKIISDMFIAGKKHYITRVLDSEGKVFKEPDYSNTGLESKKVDTPDFIKGVLDNVLKMLLAGKNKEEVTNYVRDKRKEYESIPLYELAVPGKIGDYSKYAKPIDFYLKNGLVYTTKTPRRTKAALNHNYIIRKMGIKGRMEIESNVEMRYVEVKPNNKYKMNVIGFSGEYPAEFRELFVVDYAKMWDKTCMTLLGNWYDVVKWGKPTLVQNTLFDFFK